MSNAEQPFYRRPVWIVVAIFLAVFLVGGGIAAVTGVLGSSDDDTVAEPTSVASASSGPTDDAGSVCGLEGYEEESSLTAAPVAQWQIIGSMATPQDPDSVGPGTNEDGGTFNSCFAHTAEGALFASINYLATTSDTRNVGRLADLIAEGELKDQIEATPPTASDIDDDGRAQVAGFKIDRYSAQEATVDLALAYTGGTANGQLVSLPVVMKWESGDWKVVITPSGPPIAPSALSSLGGYIPFSGV
jgi:hypothetical protein